MNSFRSRALVLTLAALAVSPLSAAGMDAARLKLIPARMQQFVDDGTISGVVTLVARNGEVAELDAAGFSDVEKRTPMRTDTIVQVMSQTKSITGVAAMILVQEGRLDLQRPVESYLPEFKGQQVEEKGGVLHKPARPPTVWQLMSHTSGLAFLPKTGDFARINFTLDATLADTVRGFAHENLVAEPGTKYMYSNMGVATLGRIVEVVSGKDYVSFVQSHIFQPLGMKDSFFFPPEDKKSRIAMVYVHENGKLVIARQKAQAGDPAKFRAGAKYPGPELGLYSTAADLQRFYQMLANGGILGGKRVLSKQTVEAMIQDYTPDHTGYGLTLSVMGTPKAMLNLISPGTYGHGGAFGTGGWVDPKNGLVMVFLPQMADGGTDQAKNLFWQLAESAVQ